MFQHDIREITKTQRKSELYVELIIRFTGQGILKGAMYGAGLGVCFMIIGALYGAPIGAIAGGVFGLVEGMIVGYFVVYQDMPFETTGSTLAIVMTLSMMLIGAAVPLIGNPPDILDTNIAIEVMGLIILAPIAGLATWHGSLDVAKWYTAEILS